MMYTTAEAADLIGVKYYQLTYLLRTHKELDVNRFNYRRVFTPNDVLALAKAFKVPDEKFKALATRFPEAAKADKQGEHSINN
ncbi:unnamed protein product [Gemmataceae bacterium]|nr:unnamed protein product [Gemmataceae bacterium]VTT96349.1 unnamed protein product [Gemmataceae bacterium]